MKYLFICILLTLSVAIYAQKETFDLIRFLPPSNWKKETRATLILYSTINNKNRTWCQIGIVKSTISKGDIQKDFNSEWQELVVKNYSPTEGPTENEIQDADGWKIKMGEGKFKFNNAETMVMLTTISGYNRCVSFVITTNSEEYFKDVDALLESVELIKPDTLTAPLPATADKKPHEPAVAIQGAFTFTTTNFDNGWTSTVQEDWVHVTKGAISVLIHYPNKSVDDYNPDLSGGLQHAWTMLAAPRYSNISNLMFRPVSGWQSIEFAECNAIEKETGKTVYVVLFKKNLSGGSGKYLEFIMPDKRTYENEFGTYENAAANYGTGDGWDRLVEMANYNKFAVSAADLQGKWSNNFSAMQQYVNAYTGASAGANTHASNETFEFGTGKTYHWNLGVASGFTGNIKFQSVKSTGNFSNPDNWHISFSDIEGKPKNYDAFFSCIKGARLLWIDGKAFGRVH